MGDGTAVALWFGASGFEVLEVGFDGIEVTVAVQTTATTVGCSSCGTRAVAKDRRWVTLRDAPTVVAAVWATDQVAAIQATPASLSRDFGVAWSTVWSAVQRVGRQRIDDPARVGPTAMVGFDETVMQPAHRRRRRRLVTAVVDVAVGQILDVFEGHDAKDLRAWMAAMPAEWLAAIEVVSVDPHEGYRSAVTNPDPATGRLSPLADVQIVVDPFHVVRLANMAVTRARQRVQPSDRVHPGRPRRTPA